eukprot:SAG31_NODE_1132_length_9746_cov_6.720639_6_plen_177_part_00
MTSKSNELTQSSLPSAAYNTSTLPPSTILSPISSLSVFCRESEICHRTVKTIAQFPHHGAGVKVTTTDGEQYDGKYAIVTLPLAVLQASCRDGQQHESQAVAAAAAAVPTATDGDRIEDEYLAAVKFVPALSARKCDAIQAMGVRCLICRARRCPSVQSCGWLIRWYARRWGQRTS